MTQKTYKIKCYSEEEAEKLFDMLNKLKQVEYIEEGEIELDKRVVIFKTKCYKTTWIK